MPHNDSAKKRLRQAEKRNSRNRSVKHAVKTQVRKVLDALEEKDLETARSEYRLACKRIDKATARNTIHRNTAARRKSHLATKIAELEKGGGGATE